MRRRYKIFRLLHLKKELKEIYANQLIEYLAGFIIGIFIPAFIIQSGFSFAEAVLFMIIQCIVIIPLSPLAARINARIGIKHTILLRAPVLMAYLSMVMLMESMRFLYLPAALAGGLSLALYWISINVEYVWYSDKHREGEEAGILFGVPYISSVLGPVIGALVLTLFGFPVLFSISVILIAISVIPLFLSGDYMGEIHRMRDLAILIDRKRALWYLISGAIHSADFLYWGLFVFLSYGFLSLGISASMIGLGMIIFTLLIGTRTNNDKSRKRAVKIGGFLCMTVWLLRSIVTTELQVMLLSLAGGFVIMLCTVPLFADFSKFAKNNGPTRSVVFRNIWQQVGRIVPFGAMLLLIPLIGEMAYLQAAFVATGILSGLLMFFRN